MSDTTIEPQWRVTFIPEQESRGYITDIDCDETNTWYISDEEAEDAMQSGWFSESLIDTRDPRLPEVALTHSGPFSVELRCTGCGRYASYADDITFADHADCAPSAPKVTVPVLSGPELSRPWAAALRESTLLGQAAVVDPGPAVPYTIELRFEVLASPAKVAEITANLAALTGGRHTATFDENWDELDSRGGTTHA
ncbi:hypothetical protein [Gordonia sihwensis]|uniref:hypothetical protein n=1 Tax=Gordonia sihwensis TaxID=173559 RepID=UPI0005EFAB54|nr:hypothetical protein [Gordonia sihwensis]KJR10581.1 hypothetical protein UG54_00915 [Gordonia sihwensis]